MGTLRKNTTILVLLLIVSFIAFGFIGNTPTIAGDTTGTPDHPFQIGTADELRNFRDHVNNGNPDACAILSADIDLGGASWTPIGLVKIVATGSTFDYEGLPYTGTFDGAGYEISGLNIQADYIEAGLFGSIEKGGAVKNLTVSGNITGTCYLGGIAGSNYGTIQNCCNKASINGISFIGGITGENISGSIENCANQGAVISRSIDAANGDYANFTGGIAGASGLSSVDSTSSAIKNCFNTGAINSNGKASGGIAGYSKGTILNVYNSASVSGAVESGSLIGHNAGSVDNAYYVTGTNANAIGMKEKDAAPIAVTADKLKSASIIVSLNKNGDSFKIDVADINNGYPVLLWQDGELIHGFYDIKTTAWYSQYVADLAEKGIINGKSPTIFDPDGMITRAEFAKILAASSGDDLSGYNTASQFTDVGDKWYRPYINWAFAKGIVNGKSASTFGPNDNITRQEMAVMMTRYANSIGFTLPSTIDAVTFGDANKISTWAIDAVAAMQRAGIINGKGNNLFDPLGNATRAEASKMVSIFLQLTTT